MKIKDAKAVTGGGISSPSSNNKMTSSTYSLTPDACNVGGKLRNVEGSTCKICYADKMQTYRKNVKAAWHKRTDIIRRCETDTELRKTWVEAMATLINKQATSGLFRWHVGGDVQGLYHFKMIADVATQTPDIKHWLPTREYGAYKAYKRDNGAFPDNLVVRVSDPMVDQQRSNYEHSSGTHTQQSYAAFRCPAYDDETNPGCGDCTACYDPTIARVSYPVH